MSTTAENLKAAWSNDLEMLNENLRRRFDAMLASRHVVNETDRADVSLDRRIVLIETNSGDGTYWVTVHDSEQSAAQYLNDSIGEAWVDPFAVDLLDGELFDFEVTVRARLQRRAMQFD